jgi:hypothetical protein
MNALAMNCHDAREGFSALFRGGMSLTEWALVEAHGRQCVECGKEREYLQQVVSSRRRVAPSRAVRPCRRMVIDAIHLGTTSVAAWLARLHVVLAICFPMSVQAAGRVIAASRVGAMQVVDLLTRVRCQLPKLFQLSERTTANVIEATGFVIPWFADLLARLHLSLTIAFQRAARAAREAARAGVTRVVGLLTRVRCLLPALLKVPERAAGNVMGPVRFIFIRFAPCWPDSAGCWRSPSRCPCRRRGGWLPPAASGSCGSLTCSLRRAACCRYS